METIATTLQALNVQRPPPPVRDNVEQQDENKDDEDDEANQFAAVDDNPFAPLQSLSSQRFLILRRQNKKRKPKTQTQIFEPPVIHRKPMPENSSSEDYAMEKASGPHFSGLRFDSLLSSSPPNPSVSSPSHLPSAVSSSSSPAPKQPFVIGN
ncbi:hypothetical protein F2Q70_00027410 [Brassica cretica]|uniref:Uncharacterized protein n=1 Tax=Brassica cretica TaxID=69181 RepID=A0A8S9LAK4_BRACR|nr:hypothetical protein F2Q70_00027410 [Brassica cretica]